MRRGVHLALLVLGTCAVAFATWRIVALMEAEVALQRDDAETALRWNPDDPRALLMRAEERLSAKDFKGAAATARQLLQQSPSDGRAFRILAQLAQARGEAEHARVLFGIAARRAPRDLPTRAWLAQDALVEGDYPRALGQIDAVLTMSPGATASTLPLLVSLATDPEFATALAHTLRNQPEWRPALMQALAAPETGNPVANDLVLGALQRNGGLDATETSVWLDSLMRQGRWGEAYARWASSQAARGDRLPLLYNGDFAEDPSGVGFDWRGLPVPGLILGFEPAAGVEGRAAHLRFLGRRVIGRFLTHPLLLPPGRYRLEWRERAEALRGDTGIEWTVGCDGESAPVLSRSQPSLGTHAWRVRSLEVDITSVRCSGQWLQLAPAGPAGAGQVINGDLWVANVSLTRL